MNRPQIKMLFFMVLIPLVFSSCSVQTKPDNKGGVYKSADAGETFEQKVKISENSSLADSTILAMTFDPQDSNIIFVGTASGLFRTKNSGDDWESLKTGFRNVTDIIIHPENSDIIYLSAISGGTGKIVKTIDGGENWEELYPQRTSTESFYSVEIDYDRPNSIYAGDSSGAIFKSDDAGETWRTLLWHSGGIREIEIDSVNPKKVYFISSKGMSLRTDDGGENFVEISSGGAILALVPHPYKENVIYISDEAGIHRSEDGGINFTQIRTLVRPEEINSRGIAIDPKDDRIIYFISGKVVYKSINSGDTWRPVQFSIPRKVTTILIDPEHTDTLYFGTRRTQQKKGMGFFPF